MKIKGIGIDVSHNNGVIDWEKVKAAGIQFAMLRCGYGSEHPSQIDKQFERNYAECKRIGMPVGAYHYSYAVSVEAARNEAKFMQKLLAGKQFEYPVVFDVEDAKIQGLGKPLLTNITRAFCEEMEKAGYYVAYYSNPDWLINRLDVTQLAQFDLWLAEWRNPKQYKGKHGIWQYTEKGTVNGIKGNVDMDFSYLDYPSIIKKAGLNGFKKAVENKPAKYTVTATQGNLTKDKAEETAVYLQKMGMTVVLKEDK